MSKSLFSFEKSLGVILISVSIIMLLDLVEGKSAGGALVLSRVLNAPEYFSLIVTAILILIGFGFGLRALIWNKVCIGDQCNLENS